MADDKVDYLPKIEGGVFLTSAPVSVKSIGRGYFYDIHKLLLLYFCYMFAFCVLFVTFANSLDRFADW